MSAAGTGSSVQNHSQYVSPNEDNITTIKIRSSRVQRKGADEKNTTLRPRATTGLQKVYPQTRLILTNARMELKLSVLDEDFTERPNTKTSKLQIKHP